MKYLLEMNHFLPTLKTGNTQKSNIQFDEIPENIKEFFSRNNRNLSMISEIHEDGSVDVNGDINIHTYDLIDGKFPFKFGYVIGNFNCSCNGLTSLEGCPQKVEGYFRCYSNQLTSLKCGPQEVGGEFDCEHNKLASLEGCPQKVGGYFKCSYNKLTSLDGCPQTVGGDFDCHNNELTSLEGCPHTVRGYFSCRHCQLTSLDGCPKEVSSKFYCGENPGNFTEDDVIRYCNVKGKIEL